MYRSKIAMNFMNTKKIYVAATSQHIGKTTSTLGLVHAFRAKGYRVGYCKPVGQQFVDLGSLLVDKDALLFSDFMQFDIDANLHSPVILGKGATAAFLDNPTAFDYDKRISIASHTLVKRHNVIIYEGTGHPGVGSVVNLSNPTVAKMIGASVILVVEGGIGNTIDRINLSLSLFREQNVPIIGIIVNKVLPQKLERVKKYVGNYLKNQHLPLLGVVPYDKSLALPLMKTINKAVKGKVLCNAHKLTNRIERTIDSSLVDMEAYDFNNLLLVITSRLLTKVIQSIKVVSEKNNLTHSPLSGIILTANYPISEESQAYIDQYEIPVLHTNLDTYGAVIKISKIEVKINLNTPWKVKRAVELMSQHVDLEMILKRTS